ncbi:MAG: PKD domain-containing protein [Thermoplasmatales archaeon]|nr:MAG: PKD domain-containing protein [Thermoplasmatales archaeon]
MKKKIVSIFVCMLLCVTVSTVTGTMNDDFNEGKTEGYSSCQNLNRTPWDFQFTYDVQTPTGDSGLGGVEFDGTHFYVTKWNGANIYQFDKEGNYIGSFTIPGVSQLRDLAYDGTYFYGGDGLSSRIWEMDLATQTLVSTITTAVDVRSCAYDADADGGNGGFWVNVWSSDLKLLDRTGAVLDTITAPPSLYGSAWDNVCTVEGFDGPFLWIFTGTSGSACQIEQYDLATKTLTGVTHSVSGDLGTGIAGGLFFTTEYNESYATLGGLIQGTPLRLIFGYEMCELNTPPNTPSTPSGPDDGVTGVEYEFETETTDPEGDQVSYMFDWGDGTFSAWSALMPHQTPYQESHAWDTAGTYEVRAKAKDANGGESDWSSAHTITIVEGPIVDIGAVTGGLFRVNAKIKNDGAVAATGVQWSISLVGGAFIGKETTGTDDIPAFGEITATSKLIIGFGATVVTVTAEIPEMSDTKELDGFVLLFLINVKPGGG